MRNTHVLIAGAGVAGPSLAFCLRRHGIYSTIVERAPALRPGGQTVDLRGAARDVVEWMGCMDRVRELAVEQRGIAFVDARGRTIARMPADLFGGEGIVSELEILRGDLVRVLHEATVADTEYIFDDTITALAPSADGVTVSFESAPPRRFDVVVGADGLHSVVRGLAFGPDAACVRRLDCYLAWFTAPAPADLDGWYLMHNAPGGRVASVRPGRVPGESKVSLAFRSVPLAYDRRDVAAQKALVAQHFAGVEWHVPQLLDAMQGASDFVMDPLGQVHLDRWSRGRVVLLGDAGYCATPLTGLGTSLAVVGAYVLAGELASADGDHEVAFARYESALRRWVTKSQELPPGGINGFAPESAVAISLRAASMRWMCRWPFRALLAGQFAKAGDIVLSDYA
ncbi:MAG: FAD-binding monooxygenase [Myxococcaceae bacterium]|nr:FAD-binding monooxygenase [Myxococcaceae bacterium]